jgi:predicted Zn-dependent protease
MPIQASYIATSLQLQRGWRGRGKNSFAITEPQPTRNSLVDWKLIEVSVWVTPSFRRYAIGLSLLAALLLASAVNAADSKEKLAGFYIDQYMLGREVILFAPGLEDRVSQIADRLKKANSLDPDFRVRLLNNPVANAYASPGGFLYVTTGLVELSKSDDELAGAISHELAHVVQHHYFAEWEAISKKTERYERYADIAGFIVSVGAAWVIGPPKGSSFGDVFARVDEGVVIKVVANAALATIGGLVLMSSLTGYERERELEADSLAIIYTERAGYNPRALIALLKRLAFLEARARSAKEPQYVSKLVSAKPGLDSRIDRLTKRLCPNSTSLDGCS